MVHKVAVCLFVAGMASAAAADMVLELVPDDSGPYFGGESLTVGFNMTQDPGGEDAGLRHVAFDFTATDSALDLSPAFNFDYSEVTVGGAFYAEFPDLFPESSVASTTYTSQGPTDPLSLGMLVLPGEGVYHAGTVGVILPTDPGDYILAAAGQLVASPPVGDVVGGLYTFTVVPEPACFALLGFGALALLRRSREA